MVFHGFQKMTLLDYPGRVACTLFTGGCNLRCPFCHNALLVTDLQDTDTIDESTVLDFLKKRQGLLDGVCITGGEPLLCADIAPFMRKVKALGFRVKLDTNGTDPDRLQALLEEKLPDYVAVDIKNAPEKYAATVGVPDFDIAPVEESVRLLMRGEMPYEFRTTVVKEYHQPEDIEAAARWIRGAQAYFLQIFTDSGNLIGEEELHAPDTAALHQMRERAAIYVPNTQIRGL